MRSSSIRRAKRRGHQSDRRLRGVCRARQPVRQERGRAEANRAITSRCWRQNRTGFQESDQALQQGVSRGLLSQAADRRELLAAHSEGLICLSGCVSGELSRALLSGNTDDEAMLTRRGASPPGFTHVRRPVLHRDSKQRRSRSSGRRWSCPSTLAKRMGLPLVATSDAHYVRREDAVAQDVLLCINTGKFRTDTNRMRMEGDQFFLRSPEEMYAAFPGLEDAVARSQQIADSVDIATGTRQAAFPVVHAAGRQDDGRLSARAVRGGLARALCRRSAALAEQRSAIGRAVATKCRQRLERELDVIEKLGFCDYFLIVWDFVRYAMRAEHSLHGPRIGRRLARLLRAEDQPRLPAAVRPAVRAVSGRKPPRGARYRHRLLQGSPRRSHSVREGQVRRGERRPDRHVRHAGRPGGDSRRRPHARHADLPRRSDRGDGARSTRHLARRSARSRATT